MIANYNGAAYLRDLVRSVEAQTVAPAELLVVDNASTDGSVELLRREFPQVRVVQLDRNDGPCPARNRGLREARFDTVFSLDCDLILAPDCLERCLAALATDPAIAVVQPRSTAAEQPDYVQYDGAWFHYVGVLTLRNFYVPLSRAEGGDVEPVDAFISLAALCRRAAVLDAGGYDPAFFILFEDSDLSYRLRSSGARIVCAERAAVVHRGGTAGTSFRRGVYPSRRVYLHACNRWLFLVKNYQASTLLRGLPGLLLYEVTALLFACAKLAPHSYIHGKLAFLARVPGALRARAETKRRRRVSDRELVRGGSLTLWPPLTTGRTAAAFGHALDATLGAWWRLVGGRA